MKRKEYNLVKNLPVLRCYYPGGHSHPVRRTGLIIESNDTHIVVYELREGNIVRSFEDAPVKTYRRDKIARLKQCGRRLRNRTPKEKLNTTSLKRTSLLDLIRNGS